MRRAELRSAFASRLVPGQPRGLHCACSGRSVTTSHRLMREAGSAPTALETRTAARGAKTDERGPEGQAPTTDLSDRIRRRDPQALEELYRVRGRRAFGLAYRVLGDAAAAEDAVQDAFLAVWDGAERVDARRGRVESLLMTMVHRRAIDQLRARSRRAARQVPVSIDIVNVVDERAADLFDAVSASVSAEQVRAALGALPAEQRAVIELAYFEGLTHREIAERSELALGTVKSRLRLGMEKLRGAFGLRTARPAGPTGRPAAPPKRTSETGSGIAEAETAP